LIQKKGAHQMTNYAINTITVNNGNQLQANTAADLQWVADEADLNLSDFAGITRRDDLDGTVLDGSGQVWQWDGGLFEGVSQ